ncbi:ATP-binding cassette domain-containing protein, partial [Chloroflexota bacterium]
MAEPILQVRNLEVKYHTREGTLTAIRDASFEIGEAEILGVVGESGCGKSTVASAVMRLLPPNGELSGGQILFRGQDLCQLDEESMRGIRGRELAMIFQDAMTSLNPVFGVDRQMIDALKAQRSTEDRAGETELRARAIEMLDRVGIPDP